MDRELQFAAGPTWWHVDRVSAPRFLPPEVFLPAMVRSGSYSRDDEVQQGAAGLLLAACHADQTAADTSFMGVARGAFSFYATQALDAQAALTYDTWFAAIGSALPSDQYPQRPVLSGSWWQRSGRVFGG
jgi:hypothetical protein